MKPILFAASILPLFAGAALAGVLSPGLEKQLEGKDEGEIVKVWVVMNDQPDVRTLEQGLLRKGTSFGERHESVVSTLREAAQLSQQDLLGELTGEQAAGGIRGHTPHWIVNSVVVTATVAKVRELALRGDVFRIEPDLRVEPIEPVLTKGASPSPGSQAEFTTPGLTAIGVPRVWAELGIDGTGTIVANMDSGVDGSHPALASRWRGNFVSPAQTWQDHANVGSPSFPVDVFGHGTHVMGTITGATAFEHIGVAPGAHWIASNAIASDEGGFDNAVIAAFEWLADPDGDPSTSDDVPDVVQNSWGIDPSLGSYLECDSTWWQVIDNCEAAGVVVVFSAGNDGPGPESVRSPGNRASSPTNAFSVGSTSTSVPYPVSLFSSRGPSPCGGEHAIKPEVVAPGQDILSSIPGGRYGYMSGTSMAGPHVAGVVALMRQANPDVDVATIKDILMETARDLGTPGEDNDSGHGLVDAYEAVMMVLDDVGSISGIITDSATGLPLEGARIRDLYSSSEAITEVDGAYHFTMRAGPTTFEVSKFGYQQALLEVEVPAGAGAVHDILVTPSPWARLHGVVRGPDAAPLEGATVRVLDVPVEPVISDATGAYEFVLPAGTTVAYVLEATAPGLAYDIRHTGLQDEVVLDFHLPLIRGDGFESGDFQTLSWTQGGALGWTIDATDVHEGAFSARSGPISDGQTSALTLDYYVNGDGPFSFWLMTESEVAYDRLVFSIDGQVEGTWSGQVSWTKFEQQLDTGLHRLHWLYLKDTSVSAGRDAAWIDEVILPGTGIQPLATLALDSTEYRFDTRNDAVETFPLSIGNDGSFSLEYSVELTDAVTGQELSWASVDPRSGVVHPANRNELNLTFDGYQAGAGMRLADLRILSNDPAHPDTTVSISLVVEGVTAADDLAARGATLLGAVPNPFNPATEIRYELPRATVVSLEIYDVSGRHVRTLVRGRREAGAHRARWDGRDGSDHGVASGVYFVRLQSGGTSQTRALTLVR